MFLTKEQLTRPPKTVEVEITGLGVARIRELSRSSRQDLDLWLRPDGKLDKARESAMDLKLVSLCLENDEGELMFDCSTDEAFTEFESQVESAAAGPWSLLIHEVMKANGFITDEVEDDLLGK